MKYYDKEIYKMEQKMKIAFFTILVFTMSFSLGVFIGHTETAYKNNQIIKQLQIEIDNLKN